MKLIFLDIDGTLVTPGSMEPSERVMTAIRKAQAAGHKVFLATGRSRGLLTKLLALGFDGAVCSAGGYIYIGDEKIYDCPIPSELVDKTRKLFLDAGMGLILECENSTYGADSFGEVIAAADGGSSELERWRKMMESDWAVHKAADYKGGAVYKMCFATENPKTLEAIRPQLEENFKVCMFDFRPNITNGEIVYKAFDKGRAMKRVCEYYGVSIADTIAFGDSANDTEMLEAAGIGYCMANGMHDAKAAADRICPPVSEDGVAAAFEELNLYRQGGTL